MILYRFLEYSFPMRKSGEKLLYSVECGLKSLLMKVLGNNTYGEFVKCCGNEEKVMRIWRFRT